MCLRTLIAVAFSAAAFAKLAAVRELVAVYDGIGIGQWFRYATVVVEVTGIVGIIVPRGVAIGALLLAVTMLVAALICVFLLGSSPIPALVLGGLCALLAYLERNQLTWIMSRLMTR